MTRFFPRNVPPKAVNLSPALRLILAGAPVSGVLLRVHVDLEELCRRSGELHRLLDRFRHRFFLP